MQNDPATAVTVRGPGRTVEEFDVDKASSTRAECSIEGCGRQVPRRLGDSPAITPPKLHVKVCTMHAVAIWRQVQISTDKRAHIEAFIQFGKAVDAELNRDRTVPKVRKSISNYVEMVYFVRLNDLIKVGWSRNLRERFRAYGPSVEVLCHYPGTRKDETELHQILTPFRAKGREWYHDSPMIQKLVAEKVDEHGPPYIQAQWTEPKKPATKPRYWAA